jgi:hypothetical protein
MTIGLQSYLQGYLHEKTAAVPRDRVDDTPTQVTEGQPLTPEDHDLYVYKDLESGLKDRRGFENYRALQSAAREDPQSPTVETWAQWKLKNTPPYNLSHIISPDAAKNIRVHNKIMPYRKGGTYSFNTGDITMNAANAKGNVASIKAHEIVHGRQDYESDQLPWYSPKRRGNPFTRFLDDWRYELSRRKRLSRFQKEVEQREAGLQDLRRAGIPPSVYAGDLSANYLTYASSPREEQAFAEMESWARGRNMPFTYPGAPQWYNDIIRDKGEEAAVLEFRRRRALKARKILADRVVQAELRRTGMVPQKIEPSGSLKDQTIMTYAADPINVQRKRAFRKRILKLLEDPNSPFREKLLQAGWGNVKHGLPSAEEGKQ